MNVRMVAKFLSVGELKEKNGFKRCMCEIETKHVADEFGDTLRQSEIFPVEYPIKDDAEYGKLVAGETYYAFTCQLRSYTYNDRGAAKRAIQITVRKREAINVNTNASKNS